MCLLLFFTRNHRADWNKHLIEFLPVFPCSLEAFGVLLLRHYHALLRTALAFLVLIVVAFVGKDVGLLRSVRRLRDLLVTLRLPLEDVWLLLLFLVVA